MKQIDLVIPGLLNLPAEEFNQDKLTASAPCLQRCLRFADQEANFHYSIDAILIHILGLNQAALPYTRACLSQSDGLDRVLVEPVYLKADINDAVLYPVNERDQFSNIINDLNSYFKVNCNIEFNSDNYWLMQLHDIKPVIGVPHYLSVLGNKAGYYHQRVEADPPWIKFINEIQMFLYQHESNQPGQLSGSGIINSLWCWGADAWQGEFFNDLLWFSNDSLMQNLGRLYSGHSQPLSALKSEARQSKAIIIDLSLLRALKGETMEDIPGLVAELEKNILQPVMEAKPNEIRLFCGGAFNFRYKPRYQWKIWKRPLSFIEY